uniref:Prolyl 4-hydroxylase alpha subunit domain-containing protein n=1 Tax=Meloidogyne floridensis TaxID=298350 RepID=A0A915NE56_9BILA
MPRMTISKVQHLKTGEPIIAPYRISKIAWLFPGENKIVLQLFKRMVFMTNLNMLSAEPFQDNSTNTKESQKGYHIFNLGTRIATALFYLSTPEKGGYTVFSNVKTFVKPTKNDALFWYNLWRNGNGDFRTRHAACPVLLGDKWIAAILVLTMENKNKFLQERVDVLTAREAEFVIEINQIRADFNQIETNFNQTRADFDEFIADVTETKNKISKWRKILRIKILQMNLNKKKKKTIPNELLVDIFKSLNIPPNELELNILEEESTTKIFKQLKKYSKNLAAFLILTIENKNKFLQEHINVLTAREAESVQRINEVEATYAQHIHDVRVDLERVRTELQLEIRTAVSDTSIKTLTFLMALCIIFKNTQKGD